MFSEGLERPNRGHDLVGDFLVDGFEAGFRASAGLGAKGVEGDRQAVFNLDADWPWESAVFSPGLERAEDADRNHGGGGFYDRETDAGPGASQLSIRRASALREEEDGAPVEQAVEDGAQSGGAAPFAIDGHGINLAEDGAEDRQSEQ